MTIPPPNEQLSVARLRLASCQRSPRTIEAYATDWRVFDRWCASSGRGSLPASAETAALFVTAALEGHKISTVARYAAAISYQHRCAGLASPCERNVYELLAGAQRLRCERPAQKQPLTLEDLRAICRLPATGPRIFRDRAILLLGFATSLRRSNLCALNIDDVEFTPEGLIVRVRREKNDQQGRGRAIGVPPGHGETCPVAALRAWLDWRGTAPGPLFTGVPSRDRLAPNRIAAIVKRAAAAIGLDPRQYAGHSLRSGFVTEAVLHGAGELLIMRQTGHRSVGTLRRYFRATDLFRSNACAVVGL